MSCAVFYFRGKPVRDRFKEVSMRNKRVITMVECAIMIALASILSVIKIVDMPVGGSVTLASMLPIVIIAYRHGIGYGMVSATIASAIQLILGFENFSYVTGWQSILALAIFDYILAYAIFGVGGIFRRVIKNQALAMVAGISLGNAVRYVCHVISGATIWAGLPIPDAASLSYSVSYNAVYMIPELIISALLALYLGGAIDFRRDIPTRVKSEGLDNLSVYSLLGAAFAVMAALVTDTALIFSKLQGESGEIDLGGLAAVNWLAVGIVSAVMAAIAISLILVVRVRSSHTENK